MFSNIYFAMTLSQIFGGGIFTKTKRDKYLFDKYIFHNTVYDYFVKMYKYYF